MSRALALLTVAIFLTILCSSLTVSSRVEDRLSSQQPSPSPTPPINNGSFPVVSPDGSGIAFTSNRSGVTDVYLISVDGTREQQLTSTPESEGNLSWTTGGQVSFSVYKDNISHLYAIDPVSKAQRVLASVPGRAPTMSADGKLIVYMTGTYTATKLIVSNIDGSNPKQITDGSSIAWNVQWAPNGKGFAFTGRDDPKSELAIFLLKADGTALRHLTHIPPDEGGAQVPRWSRDARRLAIQVNSRTQKGSAHIWIVDLVTGAGAKLAPHTESYLDETPSWFPDGKRIAFQSNRTGRMEVWVMKADGSEPQQVTGRKP